MTRTLRIVTRLTTEGEVVEHHEPGGVWWEGAGLDGLPLSRFLRRLHICRELCSSRGMDYRIEQEIHHDERRG